MTVSTTTPFPVDPERLILRKLAANVIAASAERRPAEVALLMATTPHDPGRLQYEIVVTAGRIARHAQAISAILAGQE